MKKSKKIKMITSTDKTGLMFALPFIIGFIWLFFLPLMDSLVYTFNLVKVGENGLDLTPIGIQNYKTALTADPDFIKLLVEQCSQMLIKVLVIMFVSMFLALLLNDNFPGRLLFRTILFLPVIFTADIIMDVFSELGNTSHMSNTSSDFMVMSGEMTGFVNEVIESFGFLSEYIKKFTAYAGQFFDLVWSMGIQIILFIIGLKSIPAYLYEVADMEGATKWETFWKITFPLLTPSILMCFVFTIIDYFNAATNPIVEMIDSNMLVRIDYACAQSWFYAILVFAFVLIANAIISRKIVRLD